MEVGGSYMLDNYYVYKKEVDWSLLNQGLSIPLDIQVIFQNNIKKFISRGESKDIFLILDGASYKVKLVNQKFDESKYPNHKDITQIRYNPNSEIADKLRYNFSNTYRYLYEQRNILEERQKKYFKIPEDKKEFLAIYTTEYADTYLVECITYTETAEARDLLVHENEQSYEVWVNYPETDPTASIERIQQLAKIRKLNRAIGDNLKMLYGYRCQICVENFGEKFGTHVVESHHINPFVTSINNDASNQVIICPNHHRVIHKVNAVFDRDRLLFVYLNGVEEKLLLNKHLSA
jgi:5-methylcytosine-specific restriction enzyme A